MYGGGISAASRSNTPRNQPPISSPTDKRDGVAPDLGRAFGPRRPDDDRESDDDQRGAPRFDAPVDRQDRVIDERAHLAHRGDEASPRVRGSTERSTSIGTPRPPTTTWPCRGRGGDGRP